MSSEQDLDTALALFNDGLARQRTEQQARKAIDAAERAKHDAAATVKRLQADGSATADDRAAADAAYRDAVSAFNRLRNGEAVETAAADTDADADADDASDDDSTDDAAGASDMGSADDAPEGTDEGSGTAADDTSTASADA